MKLENMTKEDRMYKHDMDRKVLDLQYSVETGKTTIEKAFGFKVEKLYDFFPYYDYENDMIKCSIECKIEGIGYIHKYQIPISKLMFSK